jgi:hypothetical protein
MALSEEQELAEYDRRMEQMAVNIEKLRQEIRMENRKFVVQALAALGTAVAGGSALTVLILHLTGRL